MFVDRTPMIKPMKILLVALALALAWGSAAAEAQYRSPYGSSVDRSRGGNSYQRRLPSFGAGSYETPSSGGISGNSPTWPPPPRIRRPIISPYLNLSRPEGIVGGVPNYYSLVRPRGDQFNRYKTGVEEFRNFEQDTQRRQRELYLQQQRDYQSVNERMARDRRKAERAGTSRDSSRPLRTQYRPARVRATGHPTSFGVR